MATTTYLLPTANVQAINIGLFVFLFGFVGYSQKTKLLPQIIIDTVTTTSPRDRVVAVCNFLDNHRIKEATGHNDGPWIDAFHASVSKRLVGKHQPWCGSVAWWIFKTARVPIKVPAPATAASWFADRKKVYFDKLTGENTKRFEAGDLLGYRIVSRFRRWRPASTVTHVGICVENRGSVVIVADGNTSNKGQVNFVDRDGDGFYIKARKRSSVDIAADLISLPARL